MALSRKAAEDQVRILLGFRKTEDKRLKNIHEYYRGTQKHAWLSRQVPGELKRLAEASRVNVLKLVVDAMVQSMYVDGFRAPREADDVQAWEIWQQNKMDARQIGIHRAAIKYGAAYATVLPGDPVPVLRGVSPRRMTALYGEGDWPMWALELRRSATKSKSLYKLFDDEAIYWVEVDNRFSDKVSLIQVERHDVGVVPVVRFVATEDLDDEDRIAGEVEPYIPLQDQINMTTFGLSVAQHFGAFKQRYILGWLAETEQQKLEASVSKLWTIDVPPDEIEVGEFSQTDLKGYIDSREASLRHLASMSQTPAHELTGQLINLSAEALAAAEAGRTRKIIGAQTTQGESHEQMLGLAGELMGVETDPMASVRWKDTEARSMSQMADALGKLVQMLGVPPQELWERVPGVSQTEVDRWRAAAAEGNAFANLEDLLRRQAETETEEL